ncbi:MAG TPA: HAMP domain-containing sensor histidine kinase [Draconibacterium sp.]|nr:HAMP domain-containing sensor histidine kinase [Draconibacterium sp.]
MTLKFKNRIALFNTLAVAFTTALVFLIICFVVYDTAYSHLDEDISVEKDEVISNLFWLQDSIIINKMPEWEEAEHSQIEVNPTFLQIKDARGKIIFRSNNLPGIQLLKSPDTDNITFYNGEINRQKIRLGQFPINNENGKLIGELIIAVSRQESYNVLNNLIRVLLISFPVVLLIQFFSSSIAASRAIKPVNQLISSASGIDDSNIGSRLKLPSHKDELYELTQTINDLLGRIEKSIAQQKQFTSDASHEIRTPLSAIRGTLEVLIRRKRSPEVYEQKISGIIDLVDRLDALLEQLLHLARIDSGKTIARSEQVSLLPIVSGIQQKWEVRAAEKNVEIQSHIPAQAAVKGDKFFLELMLDNLVNNAIKYGKQNGHVLVKWNENTRILSVEDDGIGISQKDIPHIFNRFYRADESRSSVVEGSGLGLSIVQKLAELQHITLHVTSHEDEGTAFSLQFSN